MQNEKAIDTEAKFENAECNSVQGVAPIAISLPQNTMEAQDVEPGLEKDLKHTDAEIKFESSYTAPKINESLPEAESQISLDKSDSVNERHAEPEVSDEKAQSDKVPQKADKKANKPQASSNFNHSNSSDGLEVNVELGDVNIQKKKKIILKKPKSVLSFVLAILAIVIPSVVILLNTVLFATQALPIVYLITIIPCIISYLLIGPAMLLGLIFSIIALAKGNWLGLLGIAIPLVLRVIDFIVHVIVHFIWLLVILAAFLAPVILHLLAMLISLAFYGVSMI